MEEENVRNSNNIGTEERDRKDFMKQSKEDTAPTYSVKILL